jgi:predicted PurR-regulated permease PerM
MNCDSGSCLRHMVIVAIIVIIIFLFTYLLVYVYISYITEKYYSTDIENWMNEELQRIQTIYDNMNINDARPPEIIPPPVG